MTIKKAFLSILLLSLAQQSFAPGLLCCLKGFRRGARRAEQRLMVSHNATLEDLITDFLAGFSDAMFEEGLTIAVRGIEGLSEGEVKLHDSEAPIVSINQQLFEKIMSDILRILERHGITAAGIQKHLIENGNPELGSDEETRVLTAYQAAVTPDVRATLIAYATKISADKYTRHVDAIIAVLSCIKARLTPAESRDALSAHDFAAYERAARAATSKTAQLATDEPWTPLIAAQIHAFFTQSIRDANAFFNTSQRSLISRTGSVSDSVRASSVVHHPAGDAVSAV